MTIDFHVYVENGACSIKFDENDPQRAEILDAVSHVMNANERSREADECLHAKTW